ncbi:UNVERIFIED_CONTAM: hypothetical protein Slati_4336500 [Sesamum latifolium]|uniref:Uncharacterized protein n=1 Tax=Sesamum latifolium TaxID=2727402 RepID=A0AAW2SMP8_9LAMI
MGAVKWISPLRREKKQRNPKLRLHRSRLQLLPAQLLPIGLGFRHILLCLHMGSWHRVRRHTPTCGEFRKQGSLGKLKCDELCANFIMLEKAEILLPNVEETGNHYQDCPGVVHHHYH